jgi:hypothetical protein
MSREKNHNVQGKKEVVRIKIRVWEKKKASKNKY